MANAAESYLLGLSEEERAGIVDYLERYDPNHPPAESPASFLSFATRGRWYLAPHLAYMNARVMAAAQGKTKRLIFVLPPRHGKSEFLSRGTAAWWVGTFPYKRVMLGSYEATFAATWGRKARDLLEQYGRPVFGVSIDPKSSAADQWNVLGHGGGMVTAGVGGSFTGRGADLLVVDDPIKNAEQALSVTWREKTWDWWVSTAYTRLEPGAVVFVIMTRWHEDDLVGRLIREAPGEWEIIWLPAVAMKNDQIGRAEGQALWPKRYDAAALGSIRKNIGAYYWSALYQGLPTPEGGALFKRSHFRYAERLNGSYVLHQPSGVILVPVDKCVTFQTVDLAVSTSDKADYTVIATWARTPNNDLILLSVFRERLEGPDQLGVIIQQRAKWSAAQIGIERTQYQLSMVQTALRAGLPAVGLKADNNKWARALTIAARYQGGTVYHTKGEWLEEYERELLLFDKGEHDDQVDVASYAAEFLLERTGQGVKASVLG